MALAILTGSAARMIAKSIKMVNADDEDVASHQSARDRNIFYTRLFFGNLQGTLKIGNASRIVLAYLSSQL